MKNLHQNLKKVTKKESEDSVAVQTQIQQVKLQLNEYLPEQMVSEMLDERTKKLQNEN